MKYYQIKNNGGFYDVFKNVLAINQKTLWIINKNRFYVPEEFKYELIYRDFNSDKMYETRDIMLVDTKFLEKYHQYIYQDVKIVAITISILEASNLIDEIQSKYIDIEQYFIKRYKQGMDCFKCLILQDGDTWNDLTNNNLEDYVDNVEIYGEEEFVKKFNR